MISTWKTLKNDSTPGKPGQFCNFVSFNKNRGKMVWNQEKWAHHKSLTFCFVSIPLNCKNRLERTFLLWCITEKFNICSNSKLVDFDSKYVEVTLKIMKKYLEINPVVILEKSWNFFFQESGNPDLYLIP